MLAAAVVGYLRASTMRRSPAAEGGCQAEIGVALRDGCGDDRPGLRTPAPQVVANAAEGALEHHLGMTCDPVAGFVQVPAHRALRLWRGQSPDRLSDRHATRSRRNRRASISTRTVDAMALTARGDELEVQGDLRRRFLAVSVTLC